MVTQQIKIPCNLFEVRWHKGRFNGILNKEAFSMYFLLRLRVFVVVFKLFDPNVTVLL